MDDLTWIEKNSFNNAQENLATASLGYSEFKTDLRLIINLIYFLINVISILFNSLVLLFLKK